MNDKNPRRLMFVDIAMVILGLGTIANMVITLAGYGETSTIEALFLMLLVNISWDTWLIRKKIDA